MYGLIDFLLFGIILKIILKMNLADQETYGAHMLSPRSKTWTFPNLKVPAGPAEVYLAVEEEVEPAPYGSPFRGVG